ncbi:MAG: XdhC family protein [Sphingomonas sp.]|jgi:xanthine dehydrogenase accessory factor|uniref:XdhC family protein n=1 Tax=Sphingomonas sp. TaxID=28214 RepID=UPI0035659987
MDDSGIFPFLAQKAATGLRTALVTITGVSGSSVRNPGAHLAVAADGSWRGSLSGGCIEAAVVADAVDAIAVGIPREIRFGAGSPYLDIRLPCGGSVDVLINPITDPAPIADAAALLAARTPALLALPLGEGAITVTPGGAPWRTCRDAASFTVAHLPPLALTVIGHGASVEALAALAITADARVMAMTPDRAIAGRLAEAGIAVRLLNTPREAVDLTVDPWTAIAFLFHDHDWETALIGRALAGRAFYVGAMGSRAAQRTRAAALAAAGVSPDDIARLHAPIGLIPSSRDPQVLALSTLAEIVRDFERATAREDRVTALAGHREEFRQLYK